MVRFEEITRCPLEVQDCAALAAVGPGAGGPELRDEEAMVFARDGFNVIATANTRDRGVNEMSAALKRRFNFETVFPIADFATELELVRDEAARAARALGRAGAARGGRAGGAGHHVPRAAGRGDRATAQHGAAVGGDEHGRGGVGGARGGRARLLPARRGRRGRRIVECLAGTAAKDSPEDLARLRRYLEQRVARPHGAQWRALHDARHLLPG